MPCPPAWSLPPPCTPIEWYNTPPFEATMPCDHNPVTIFPNAFTYIAINGEQVMTLGAVSLVAHTSGVLPIDRGGTGGTTPEQARTNLGLGSVATFDASDFATAAQGALATTALQPGDDAAALGSGAGIPAGWGFLADGVGGADWGAIPAALPAATQAEMEAGTESALRSMSPLLVRQGEDARLAAPPILGSTTPNRGDFTEVRLNNNADPVNFERLSLNWKANVATIECDSDGTGIERDFTLAAYGVPRLTFAATGTIMASPSGQDTPTYGVELLTTENWTAGAGWAVTVPGTYQHTAGFAETLTHSAAILSATQYKLEWTITGRTAGSITLTVGGQSTAAITATGVFGPTTTTVGGLVITPTSDFNGTITVSLVQITAPMPAVVVLRNGLNQTTVAIRAPRLLQNNFIGTNTGRFCFSRNNVGVGGLGNLTSGPSNTALGINSLNPLTVGEENVAIGFQAGAFLLNGSTLARKLMRCVHVGSNVRALTEDDTNSVVIGADGRGLGSNTTIIGNSSTTLTRLQGTVETSLDFESLTAGSGVLLRSPNGTRYRITVNDAGAVIATAAP